MTFFKSYLLLQDVIFVNESLTKPLDDEGYSWKSITLEKIKRTFLPKFK